MRKPFVVLTLVLAAAGVAGSLTGCVVAPAAPGYYGYGYGYDDYYYAPGYYAYPEPSVGIGIGFGGDHDRGWHGGHHWGGRGGWGHDR